MELVFESKPCAYLRRCVCETRTQEQTADVIVPDSCPDVERIVYASAAPIVRSRECRAGSVVVTGGLRAAAMYVPEDHSGVRVLDAYIPFSIRVDAAALTEQTQIVLHCGVCSAQARMLNSRKVLLRVNVQCTVEGYEPAEWKLYSLQQPPQQLRVRTRCYPVLLPAQTGEKSFALSETLTLPEGATMEQLCCYETLPQITERKLVGDKAVFKGTLYVKALYLDMAQQLRVLTQQIPFSQYCELPQDFADDDLSVSMAVTGAQLEADDESHQRLLLAVQLLAQCVVRTVQDVTLYEDAFAVGAELTPQWQSDTVTCQLDAQCVHQTLRGHVACECRSVVDSTLYTGVPTDMRTAGGVQLTLPGTANVLYYDHDGVLQGAEAKLSAQCDVALAPQGQCTAQLQALDGGSAAAEGSGIELRYECRLCVQSSAEQTLRTLCGGTLDTEAARPAERPSVIVRIGCAQGTLWDTAKQYAADPEAIRAANHLSGDEVTEGMVMLIPM